MHRYYDGLSEDEVWVVAHRGGSYLGPENTLYACRKALESGADFLEIDVHLTADGVPVVIHDESVDRTTDGTGLVQELNLKEIQELDAAYSWRPPISGGEASLKGKGITIPTLEEVFKALPEARLVLELKKEDSGLVRGVGEIIERYARKDETLVASFFSSNLKLFRKLYPEVATSAGRREVFEFWLFQKLGLQGLLDPKYVALQVPELQWGLRVVTPSFVEAAKRKNVSVQVWTVNSLKDMQRLSCMGIDALITDSVETACLKKLNKGWN